MSDDANDKPYLRQELKELTRNTHDRGKPRKRPVFKRSILDAFAELRIVTVEDLMRATSTRSRFDTEMSRRLSTADMKDLDAGVGSVAKQLGEGVDGIDQDVQENGHGFWQNLGGSTTRGDKDLGMKL